MRDLVNQMKASKDPNYCQRVTANDGSLGELHLRSFQDNEKSIPTILTTSQKLSTGVDARNIRNIVLMRPINSMIEFKQIIGRGTRLYDGKDYFTIYDFCEGASPLQRSRVGWRAAGTGAVPEVQVPALPVRKATARALSRLRQAALRMRRGSLVANAASGLASARKKPR